MTYPERLERTIETLRKAITTGDYTAEEVRDIEYAIRKLRMELESYHA